MPCLRMLHLVDGDPAGVCCDAQHVLSPLRVHLVHQEGSCVAQGIRLSS